MTATSPDRPAGGAASAETARPRSGAQPWRRRLTHALLITAFFGAATVVYTYPLAFHPRLTLRGGHGDYLTETSMVAWNARQTFRDPTRLFQVPFYYPYANGVAYQQSAFFTGLLAAPLLGVGIEPILAVNLLLLAGLTASGVLTYVLTRAMTGGVIPGLVAGAIFAFYPNRMDHLGQFTYQQAVLFPLIVWALYRFVIDGRPGHLWLAAVAGWAQMLSSLYNGYALAILLGGLLLGLFGLRPDRLTWALAGRLGVAGAGLGLALAPFLWPYVSVHRELGFQRTLGESDVFGMELLSILDPAEFSRFYRHRLLSLERPEGGLFPGFAALVLAGAAVVLHARAPGPRALPGWARRARWGLLGLATAALGAIGLGLAFGRAPRGGLLRALAVRDLTLAVNALPLLALAWVWLEGRRRARGALGPREWMLVLLFLAFLAYLLCLAPTIIALGKAWGVTLFRWVYLHVPGGSAFRAPGRWSLVFALPLALLAALGVRAVGERLSGPWARLAPSALLVLVLVELAVVPLPWHRFPSRPAVYDWLRDEPGDLAILQLPIHDKGADAWAMLWAVDHGKRVVNGHGGFALPHWEELVWAAEARDPDRLAAAIRTIYPVRYVVVHHGLGLGRTWRPVWELLRDGGVPGLGLVRTFGRDDEVYRVTPTPETGAVIRRQFSSDFVRRHPQAAYALRLAGADPEVDRRVEVRFNGRLLETATGPVSGRAVLPPPFPAADRNELVFQHVYDIPPAVTRSAPYRIGGTGQPSPVDLDVRSAGGPHGFVSVRVNGRELAGIHCRGYWVAALAPTDGRVLGTRRFDTREPGEESERLAAYVGGWPEGTIVVAVATDQAESQLNERAVRALGAVGGRADLRGTSGWAHVLVGVRGAHAGDAIEDWGPRAVRAVVGRDRPVPLGLTLEAFELL